MRATMDACSAWARTRRPRSRSLSASDSESYNAPPQPEAEPGNGIDTAPCLRSRMYSSDCQMTNRTERGVHHQYIDTMQAATIGVHPSAHGYNVSSDYRRELSCDRMRSTCMHDGSSAAAQLGSEGVHACTALHDTLHDTYLGLQELGPRLFGRLRTLGACTRHT